MGDLKITMTQPVGVIHDDKYTSVAKMVQLLEAKTRSAVRISVTQTGEKKVSTSKIQSAISCQPGKLDYLNLAKTTVTKSDEEAFSGHQLLDSKDINIDVPSYGEQHQLVRISETGHLGRCTKNGLEYNSSGHTVSQTMPYIESHTGIHSNTDINVISAEKDTLGFSHNKHIGKRTHKVHSNDVKTASHKNEDWRYENVSVDNFDAVEIEVDSSSTLDPHQYWENVMKYQVGPVTKITPLDPKSHTGHNCLRFVCMSDTHSRINSFNIEDFLSRVPPGDVLLHTGDFTLHGDDLEEYEDFNDFLSCLPHKLKFVIPGNHELNLDPRFSSHDNVLLRKRLGMPITSSETNPTEHIEHLKSVISEAKVLIDNMVEFCGIKIYGLPWVPRYGVLGFGLSRGYKLLEKYNQIPPGIDILMSHGPALGFCDTTHKEQHVGCAELLNSVRQRIKPKYVVHGHIHEAYGVQSDGRTIFINAAICDKGYKLSHDPIIFDYPLPPPFTREDFRMLNLDDLHLLTFNNSS